MNSQVQKIEIDLQCIRCQRIIRWAWMITYKSFRYTQLVYVCSECGNVIKVTDSAEELESFIGPGLENLRVSARFPL